MAAELRKRDIEQRMAESQLERAFQLALTSHRGQVDKCGRPYIGHVLRVMGRCTTLEQRTVAALHDVVEDTPTTLADIRSWGFPSEIVVAVDLLTRRKGRQSYSDYITDVEPHGLARAVKIADLEDHLDPTQPRPADYDSLKPRYEKALVRLRSLPLSTEETNHRLFIKPHETGTIEVEDRHALAALCLYGQPFGFTSEDVKLLNDFADAHREWPNSKGIDFAAKLDSLASRISSLLPNT